VIVAGTELGVVLVGWAAAAGMDDATALAWAMTLEARAAGRYAETESLHPQVLARVIAGKRTPTSRTAIAIIAYAEAFHGSMTRQEMLELHRKRVSGPALSRGRTGGRARMEDVPPEERRVLAAVGQEYRRAGKDRGGKLSLEDAG
jgi:hypothetical protein